MKVLFFGQDQALQDVAHESGLEDFAFATSMHDLQQHLGDGEGHILFLDWGMGEATCREVNQHYLGQPQVVRVMIGRGLSVKDFKKHQFGEEAADGYLKWPLSGQDLKALVEDMRSTHSELGGEGIAANLNSKNPEDLTFVGAVKKLTSASASSKEDGPSFDDPPAELHELENLSFEDTPESLEEEGPISVVPMPIKKTGKA